MPFQFIANDNVSVKNWPVSRYTTNMAGPAFGPRPLLVVPPEEAKEFVSRNRLMRSDRRKSRAFDRFRIYTEDYADLIAGRIADTHRDKETIREMCSFVSLSLNLALDISTEVAVVWKHDAARTIEGASDAQIKAFQELVDETRFRAVAKSWNRQGWFLGPITVLPVMRGGRMTWDTLLPHFYDVIQDPDDPWGNPIAASWDVQPPSRLALSPARPSANALVVDAQSYRYFDLSRGAEQVDEHPHGLGEFPGSTLRFDHTHATSWWGAERHRRLVDATITVGAIQAALEFVRKGQNKYLFALTGDLSGVPKGQTLDPEKPVRGDAASPQQINVDTLQFDTDPKNFISHAVWIMNTVARSYGADLRMGQQAAAGGPLAADVQFSHEALTEIRNEQIPFARDFERDLWAKAIAVAKRENHRLATDLPDPDKVRTGLEVVYPKLSRSFASPSEETQYKDWQLSKGLITFGDLLVPDMPGATAEERKQAVLDNIDDQAEVFERLAKRNQMMAGEEEVPEAKNAAQLNGAQGPKVRDGKKPPPDDKEKEEEDTDE